MDLDKFVSEHSQLERRERRKEEGKEGGRERGKEKEGEKEERREDVHVMKQRYTF